MTIEIRWTTYGPRISALREVINLKFPVVKPSEMPLNWHTETIHTCLTESCDSTLPSIQLLYTGNAVLLENSPYDKIWGTGSGEKEFDVLIKRISLKSKQSMEDILANKYFISIPNCITEQGNSIFGLNLLGRILVEQRAKLRRASKGDLTAYLIIRRKNYIHFAENTTQHW